MDEIEAEIVQRRAIERFLDRDDGIVETLEPAGQFGDDEQLVAGHAGQPHGPPDCALVLVIEGGIEQSVSVADGGNDRVDALGSIELVSAETDGRHQSAVVERLTRGDDFHHRTLRKPIRIRPLSGSTVARCSGSGVAEIRVASFTVHCNISLSRAWKTAHERKELSRNPESVLGVAWFGGLS